MYSVVIADDEVWVIKNLMRIVKWESFNMEITATATDGIEALNIVTERRPDILMTDLRMPGIDGLSLIEQYKKINPNAVCVMLSGYNEFQYVQKALRIGTFDYLLKPLDPNAIEEMLLRIATNLQEQSEPIFSNKEMNTEVTETVNKTKINAHVTEVIAYINDFYQKDLSLTSIAETLHLNASYLSDIFSKTTNTTFCRYLAKVRIEKAKQLLLYTDYSIETVSRRTGFRDYRQFIRTFQRLCEQTPSDYRNKQNGGFYK